MGYSPVERRCTFSNKEGLDNGAVGVKIWKNIGMDLRTSTGDLLW